VASGRRKSVLLVGDYAARDFREPVAWLAAHTDLKRAADVPQALSQLADWLPAVIFLVQSYPGQLPAREVRQLHAATPFSRLIALLGSWCEGEQRSGKPWAGVPRIYWHQWSPQIVSELAADSPASLGLWQLPRTATASEQLERAATLPWPRGVGLVSIDTRLFRDYEALAEACQAGGYATAWSEPGRPICLKGVAAAIWDGISVTDESQELARVVRAAHPAPVVAMVDYLRRQDADLAAAAGAAAVLRKPLLVRDLLSWLDVVVPKSHLSAGRAQAA
jgi:CheY-like chemotaxis protein